MDKVAFENSLIEKGMTGADIVKHHGWQERTVPWSDRNKALRELNAAFGKEWKASADQISAGHTHWRAFPYKGAGYFWDVDFYWPEGDNRPGKILLHDIHDVEEVA